MEYFSHVKKVENDVQKIVCIIITLYFMSNTFISICFAF